MMRNMLQRSFQSNKQTPVSLEHPDRLEAEDILPIASGHSGVPEAADSLAYDPVQRLLAVSSTRSDSSEAFRDPGQFLHHLSISDT